jgi:pimeloyl-ACP methyl ester carboxylesterase
MATNAATALRMQTQVTGTGDPLVIVPGGFTGWRTFEPHAERLSSTRKVVRVQLLNVQYGLEGRPLGSDYSVKMESGALATTIKELGLAGPLDVVGWSSGGLIALDYALEHPTRLRSLTLVEPGAFWLLNEHDMADRQIAREIEPLGALGQDDISEEQLEQFFYAAGLAPLLPQGESLRDLPQWPVWVQHRQSLRNSQAELRHKDDPAKLRSLQFPVLLIKGTGSTTYLHRIIDRLAEDLPHAEVVELPGGHAAPVEAMDVFIETVLRFTQEAA